MNKIYWLLGLSFVVLFFAGFITVFTGNLYGFIFIFAAMGVFSVMMLVKYLADRKAVQNLEKFAMRQGVRMVKKPGNVTISGEFYSVFGKIPFGKITNFIDFGNGIQIFKNKYNTYRHRSNTTESYFCVSFQISPRDGYHKIFERHTASSLYSKAVSWQTGHKDEVKVDIPQIDKGLIILSNTPDEAKRIISSISSILSQMDKISSNHSYHTIESLPTNFIIHINKGDVLIQITPAILKDIDKFYPLIKNMKEALS
jgi:hypothetical protein